MLRKIAGILGTVLLGIVSSLLATGVTTWYQGILKTQQHAGLHLDGFASFIAGLPTVVVLGFFIAVFAALAVGLVVYVHFRTRPVADFRSGAPTAALGVIRSDAITDEQEIIVQDIAPIAAAYRATASLIITLRVFAARMQNTIDELPSDSANKTQAWVAAIEPITYEFRHDCLPNLVKHKEKLKYGFGLNRSELSEEALTKDFYNDDDIRKLAFGLERILDDLTHKIVEKASEL